MKSLSVLEVANNVLVCYETARLSWEQLRRIYRCSAVNLGPAVSESHGFTRAWAGFPCSKAKVCTGAEGGPGELCRDQGTGQVPGVSLGLSLPGWHRSRSGCAVLLLSGMD